MALKNMFGGIGLDETMQRIAQYLQQIASNFARMYPTPSGQMRVSVDAGTLPVVTTVGTVTTLGNQTMQSGFQTNYDQYAQLQMCANGVRSNIIVS